MVVVAAEGHHPSGGLRRRRERCRRGRRPIELADIHFFESEMTPNTLYVVEVAEPRASAGGLAGQDRDVRRWRVPSTSPRATPGVYDLQPEKVPCRAVLIRPPAEELPGGHRGG